MEDLISRADAIALLLKWADGYSYIEAPTADAVREFEALPSAQPYTEEEIQAMQDLEQAQLDKAYQIGVEEGLRSAQPQWIPCSDRPPEVGQDILMSVGGMYTAEGCLREDGDWAQFRWNAIQRKDMVGAWMPLPEPYKGEQP